MSRALPQSTTAHLAEHLDWLHSVLVDAGLVVRLQRDARGGAVCLYTDEAAASKGSHSIQVRLEEATSPEGVTETYVVYALKPTTPDRRRLGTLIDTMDGLTAFIEHKAAGCRSDARRAALVHMANVVAKATRRADRWGAP